MRHFQSKMRALLIALTTFLFALNSSNVYPQTITIDDKYGNQIFTRSNPITHSVKRIYGVKVPITRYGVLIEQINSSNVKQLGVSIIKDYEDILNISSNDLTVYRSKHGRNSSWHLGFRQLYKDVPIWRSYVRFTIEGQGLVNTISANIHPDIKLSVEPNISADDALSAAIIAFKEDYTDTIIVKENPGLLIYPKTEEDSVSYYLTYKVDLVSKDLLYFVDAFSGEIIEVINNRKDYNNNGTVSMKYFPEHYYDTSVEYDDLSGVNVKIYNSLSQKMAEGYTNSSGYYSLTWYGAYASYYVRGQKNLSLANSYVEIQNAESPIHTYWFLPSSNYTHDWAWATDETNVYYHVNEIHDYITDSPFYFDDMDYQMDAYVHEGSDYNGWSNGTNVGFGSQGSYQWARSSDVVLHEYTHCIIYHLYNGWIGIPYTYTQGAAMDEGFADYFACTLNDDSRQGESVGLDTWRDLDNERTMDDYVYSGWGSALYWNGGIVAGAVWDMRETASIGDDLADELCFFALDRNPDEFGEMLDDILYEDDTDADVSNGTPNIDDILYAFGNHKIYPSDPDVPPPAPVIEGDLFMDYPEITWDKPSPDSKEYDIYRKIDTGSWSFLDTTSNLYYIDTDYEYFPRGDAELWYKVKTVDYDDNESNYSNTVYYDKMESTTKPIGVFRPTEYALYNAYPNPFNPSTSINYDIPKESRVTVKIFNILGITVKDYVINSQSPGWYNLTWDGTNMAGIQVPSGVYIVHFNAESLEGKRELFQQSIKVTLLR